MIFVARWRQLISGRRKARHFDPQRTLSANQEPTPLVDRRHLFVQPPLGTRVYENLGLGGWEIEASPAFRRR